MSVININPKIDEKEEEEENNRLDVYLLNYYSLYHTFQEGTFHYVTRTNYYYRYLLVSKYPENILNIIYDGIVNQIVKKTLTIRGYTPSNDLDIIIRGNRVIFSTVDGVYFSLLFMGDFVTEYFFQIGPLAYSLLYPYINHTLPSPPGFPFTSLLDYSDYVRNVIDKTPLLLQSIRMIGNFRYFFDTSQDVVVHIEKFSFKDIGYPNFFIGTRIRL